MRRRGVYPVAETFETFQGEGLNLGRRAFFVRMYGCDVKCHFCDSAATWHPDWKPAHVASHDPAALLRQAQQSIPSHLTKMWGLGTLLVVTGGEPTLYDLEPLAYAFHEVGFTVCLETAGHHPIPDGIDHITLSPKVFASAPLPANVKAATEFKIIVEDLRSIEEAMRVIEPHRQPSAPVWLHPEWSKRHDQSVLDLISRTVLSSPTYRAGYQVHKLYGVDRQAAGSDKRLVPLGGCVARGT